MRASLHRIQQTQQCGHFLHVYIEKDVEINYSKEKKKILRFIFCENISNNVE